VVIANIKLGLDVSTEATLSFLGVGCLDRDHRRT